MADQTIVIVSKVDFSKAWNFLAKIGLQKDLTPWFRAYLTPTLTAWIKYQYATKGAALGTPWAPLSEATKEIRSKRRGGSLWGDSYPMVDTGKSYRSLTYATGPNAIRQYSGYNMIFGSTLPYLQYHHRPGGYDVVYVYGKRIKKGPTHVPPRPVIPENWPTKITNEWEKSLIGYIKTVAADKPWSITSTEFL